jgi:hypothetical protein
VVYIEPVQFTVGRQIDASLPLDVENDACGVHASCVARERSEPVRYRIRADSRSKNIRFRHLAGNRRF